MPMGQNPRTITAANSVVMFTAAGYFDQAIQLQGFQVDNAFGFGDATVGETRMGVDGKQSGGWVAHEVPVTVFFEANSASRLQMEQYRAWCNANQETSLCTLDITIPSIGRRIQAGGFMVSQGGGPSAQKLINGTQYVFNMVINSEESIS
jgi:hypothetical protein